MPIAYLTFSMLLSALLTPASLIFENANNVSGAAAQVNDNVEAEIVNYVKKSSGHDMISIFPRLIPFNISTTEEDVLRKDYIGNFSFGSSDTDPASKMIIAKVEDSLAAVSRRLNSFCGKQDTASLKDYHGKKDEYALFLSPHCGDLIYGEFIHSASVLIEGDKFDIYGKVTTYLFKLSDNKIIKVYKGSSTDN